MAQELEQNGESIFNPAELWQNVLGGKGHTRPTCLMYCENQTTMRLLAQIVNQEWGCNPKFEIIYEDGVVPVDLSNDKEVLCRHRGSIAPVERKRHWKDVDFLFGDYFVVEASYSGVEFCADFDTLVSCLDKEWDDSAQRRVDAADLARRLYGY